MKREEGLSIARALRKKLLQKGFPIKKLYLFGSVARDKANDCSDIDIAVLCAPFLKTRHDENVEFLLASKDIDLRIETMCFHPDDLHKKSSFLAQKVQQEGIVV